CVWIDKTYIADAHLSCAFGQASKCALSAGWHRRPHEPLCRSLWPQAVHGKDQGTLRPLS
ncbi:MAG: hypothetical protein ACFNZW_08970, partial [Coriobacteriaceae bacterium]